MSFSQNCHLSQSKIKTEEIHYGGDGDKHFYTFSSLIKTTSDTQSHISLGFFAATKLTTENTSTILLTEQMITSSETYVPGLNASESGNFCFS